MASARSGDIFSMRGVGDLRKGGGDAGLMEHLLTLADEAADGSLTFATSSSSTRTSAIRAMCRAMPARWNGSTPRRGAFLSRLRPGDLAIFTADHGNDPTWVGTDHTRERVPVVGWGAGARAVGQIAFADVGATIAAHLGDAVRGAGKELSVDREGFAEGRVALHLEGAPPRCLHRGLAREKKMDLEGLFDERGNYAITAISGTF